MRNRDILLPPSGDYEVNPSLVNYFDDVTLIV